jgi:hypothetical protein
MTQYDTIPTSGQEYREEIQVQGSNLSDKVKELLHEGNVHRIIIRHKDHPIIEIPATAGIVGTLLDSSVIDVPQDVDAPFAVALVIVIDMVKEHHEQQHHVEIEHCCCVVQW